MDKFFKIFNYYEVDSFNRDRYEYSTMKYPFCFDLRYKQTPLKHSVLNPI